METSPKKQPLCPVEKTLSIIGKKYAPLIIRDLLTGKKRFGQLLLSISNISPRTLSARLDELERDGIVEKKIFPIVPPRVEYTLTKRGKQLHGILEQMSKWGLKK